MAPAAAKKGGGGDNEQAREVLTAVLLADSYTRTLRPVTLEQPKVLLPLVNTCMIEYVLEWLAGNGVEEVILLCTVHSEMLERYLRQSKWGRATGITVRVLVSKDCSSTGDALRVLDHRGIIRNDFVLVSGDVVTNMDLRLALKAHADRRAKDKQSIMTMVMKAGTSMRQRIRLGDCNHLAVVDQLTNRIVKYEREPQAHLTLDCALYGERDQLQVRTDLVDAHIYICAPEVLMLFSDNFDYQELLKDFVPGVLSEEELGNKIFCYELGTEYAARVHNLRSYAAISRDILQRWVYPMVPDTDILARHAVHANEGHNGAYRLRRRNVYREEHLSIPRGATQDSDSIIGARTVLGQGAIVRRSVVGRGCTIGAGAVIEDSFLFDNVTVGEGVSVRSSILADKSVVRSNATVGPNCIVSFGVVIGPGHRVPEGTRVTLCNEDKLKTDGSESDGWDRSVEESPTVRPSSFVVNAAAELALSRTPAGAANSSLFDHAVVGVGGAGFAWKGVDSAVPVINRHGLGVPDLSEDLWRSAAVESRAGGAAGGPAGDASLQAAGDGLLDEEDILGGPEDDPELHFKSEVTETFLRCVKERFDIDNVVVELNGLRLAENRSFADCARYMFIAVLDLCLPPPASMQGGPYASLFPADFPKVDTAAGKLALLKGAQARLKEWKKLLTKFLRGEDEQVDLLLTLEEFCGKEGPFEHSGQHGDYFAHVFEQILQLLYNEDIVSDTAFLAWAAEKEEASEEEKVFLKKATKFLEWLEESDEDDDDEDDDDEDDE